MVAVDATEDIRLEDEKPTVDPSFARLRLFDESYDAIARNIERTKTSRRAVSRGRRHWPLATVEREHGRNVDRSEPVTVGTHERVVVDDLA